MMLSVGVIRVNGALEQQECTDRNKVCLFTNEEATADQMDFLLGYRRPTGCLPNTCATFSNSL